MAVESRFLSVTGQELEMMSWPVEQPKAVVQLVHGMAEHIARYDATAQALNAAGFAVVGHSHLGHGEPAPIKGFFADKGGWDKLIEDVHAVRKATEKQYPGVPYFLLGHSMGSFVVRTYCLKYEAGLAGVVLSGTGHYEKQLLTAACTVCRVLCLLGQGRKPSKLVAKMVSSGNTAGFDDVQTPFDWLSRDREVVAKYIADPLCGFRFTASAYGDMFGGLTRLYPEKLGTMEKDIPVYLLSGDKDPVGANGEGVKKVAEEIRAVGVKDVTVKLYPDARHEMFNELNREEVWADLISWLESKI